MAAMLNWHDSQELLKQNMSPSSKSPHCCVVGSAEAQNPFILGMQLNAMQKP